MNAYSFYMQEQFALVRKRAPSAAVTDIATSVAKQWALLDGAARAPYDERARIDSARYYAVCSDCSVAFVWWWFVVEIIIIF